MNTNNQDNDDQGHHKGDWEQGVGGYLQFRVWTTPKEDTRRWHLPDPPDKVIPIIFLPGIMGSNLRMSKQRQNQLKREDNRTWRPDDKIFTIGLRNATPDIRQKNFDPDTTEVDYYHYSEHANMFAVDGAETQASDARHQNLPDSFAAIPPLLTDAKPTPPQASMRATMRSPERAAHKARWRGWSEVLYGGAYGELLRTTEGYLNNILTSVAGQPHKLQARWRGKEKTTHASAEDQPKSDTSAIIELLQQLNSTPALSTMLRENPEQFGAHGGSPVNEAELRRIGHCWYPVHAMGYNWLKSNGDNAKVIAERIRGLIALYKNRGLQCEKVILVTHSMGGLLARALIHPDYGNLSQQVLGIYHSAMPTHGAAAAYKRIRCGFEGGWPVADILGKDGPNVTCVLANAPGALELLPNWHYGLEWLKLVDQNGRELMALPRPRYENYEQHFIRNERTRHPSLVAKKIQERTNEATPERDIYTQNPAAWWRLFNPLWVNPAEPKANKVKVIDAANKRISSAAKFHRAIAQTFHPVTYASYCASSAQKSYGEVVWKVQSDLRSAQDGPPQQWTLVSEDGTGTLGVKTRIRKLTLTLQAPEAYGDGTVPAARSAEKVPGFKFVHGADNNLTNYSHQDSYADPQVLASSLYAIVKIAGTATWWDT